MLFLLCYQACSATVAMHVLALIVPPLTVAVFSVSL